MTWAGALEILLELEVLLLPILFYNIYIYFIFIGMHYSYEEMENVLEKKNMILLKILVCHYKE